MDAEAYVDRMFKTALDRGATDVHVEPHGDGCVVLFRVDGVLDRYDAFPLDETERITSRIKVLADLPVYEKDTPYDASLVLTRGAEAIRARLSILPTLHGEKSVIRIFQRSDSFYDLQSLGLEPEVIQDIERSVNRRQGMLLFTGPSGSGKTTTIYTLLERLHRARNGEINIVTIEDPVERDLGFAAQTPFSKCKGLSYSQALSHLLRQDPEIIVVGEIRDPETARVAVRAAMTGHLVITTIHCRETSEVCLRLLEMGVERYLIGAAIEAAVGQRLVRRLCLDCREEATFPEPLRSRFFLDSRHAVWGDVGCPSCRGTGYVGRTAIGESLPIDEPLREAILDPGEAGALRELARRRRSISFDEAAGRALVRGDTTIREVLRALPEFERGQEYEYIG